MKNTHAPSLELWTVRGTVNGADLFIVVQADSRDAAEAIGWKRGIPVVIVSPATPEEIDLARENNLLWQHVSVHSMSCLGQPVTQGQIICLLLCGVAVTVMNFVKAGLWVS